MNDDARRMVEAIDVINRATFTAGEMPADEAPSAVQLAWDIARRAGGTKLRNYQHAGISSRTVAEAIEAGVLVVTIPAEGGDR